MSLFVFFWLYLLLFHNQTRICNNSFLFQEIHLCNLARLFWMYHVCQEMVSPVNILSCFFFWCFFWKPVSPFSCAKNISILRVNQIKTFVFFSVDDVICDFLETLYSSGILQFASSCFRVHDILCPVFTCFVWIYISGKMHKFSGTLNHDLFVTNNSSKLDKYNAYR